MVTAETSTIITLTDEEWQQAIAMGKRRDVWAEDRHLPQTDGTYSMNHLTSHVQGAGGEIAAARYYEIKWDATINTFRKIPDLVCCEVRSTGFVRPWLRIKETDKPGKSSWPFLSLLYVGNKTYELKGWIYGYEGMLHGYWHEPDEYSTKPEWRVPHGDEILKPPFVLQPVLLKLRELGDMRAVS